jgi:hypothetical protein
MQIETALSLVNDTRALTRDNIIQLGWNHFTNIKLKSSESDIFVIRDYNTPSNINYSIIHLSVLWRNKNEAEILIGYEDIYGAENRSEALIIDENENFWADCVINHLFELRLLMQMCEINYFLNPSNN